MKEHDQEATVRDILEETLRLLEERGWTQGTFVDETGQVCLAQAFHEVIGCPIVEVPMWDGSGVVTGSDLTKSPLGPAAVEAYEVLQRECGDIVTYNDEDDTTYEDVVLVIKRAISQI